MNGSGVTHRSPNGRLCDPKLCSQDHAARHPGWTPLYLIETDPALLREVGPCIGCHEEADEYCPQHGRNLTDWQDVVDEVVGRNNRLLTELTQLIKEVEGGKGYGSYAWFAERLAEILRGDPS